MWRLLDGILGTVLTDDLELLDARTVLGHGTTFGTVLNSSLKFREIGPYFGMFWHIWGTLWHILGMLWHIWGTLEDVFGRFW